VWLWHNKVFILKVAARCCRASFEGPAFPSGNPVLLISYTVSCYGKYLTSELTKFIKFLCDYDIQSKRMYCFFHMRLHAVVARRWRDPFTPTWYTALKRSTFTSPETAVLIYVSKLIIIFQRIIIYFMLL